MGWYLQSLYSPKNMHVYICMCVKMLLTMFSTKHMVLHWVVNYYLNNFSLWTKAGQLVLHSLSLFLAKDWTQLPKRTWNSYFPWAWMIIDFYLGFFCEIQKIKDPCHPYLRCLEASWEAGGQGSGSEGVAEPAEDPSVGFISSNPK